MKKLPKPYSTLFEIAQKSRLNSYSPYSGCKVGAAIRTQSGETYGGCNVENASYGGTICAERVAIQKAVSEEGPKALIKEILVVTDDKTPWTPCGLCRQVIQEFAASPKIPVLATNLQGDTLELTLGELLPHAFSREKLKK